MRTAVTISIGRDGKEALLFGPSTPVQEQIAFCRAAVLKPHAEFCALRYQESDQEVRMFPLASPAQEASKVEKLLKRIEPRVKSVLRTK